MGHGQPYSPENSQQDKSCGGFKYHHYDSFVHAAAQLRQTL
jgi:hypothetical protein